MKRINDIDINNKKVVVRFDYNVPIKDNKIMDDTRITKSLKTLNYILERASKVIILSHLGRIKCEEDKKNNSLKIVCDYLSNLINRNIAFCDYTNEEEIINNNDIIMMENTRFFDLDNNKESNCDRDLSKYFASFGEVFINDAFAVSHRKNASNVGITEFLPSTNGFLIEEEIDNLNKVMINPSKPFIVLLGGAKISDKIKVIDNLINKVDKILIGGGMVYTFLKAKGIEIGKSICEDDYLEYANDLLNKYPNKIELIIDNITDKKENKSIYDMTKEDKGLDIGEETIKNYTSIIKDAKTVFFNGTFGLCEEGYTNGTKCMLEELNKINGVVVIGGGDTISSVNSLLKDNNFILSTGGGASLEYIEGNTLPGVIL